MMSELRSADPVGGSSKQLGRLAKGNLPQPEEPTEEEEGEDCSLVAKEQAVLVQVPGMVRVYLAQCRMYQVDADAGVLLTLRFQLPDLRVSGSFSEKDMLPLADLLIGFGGKLAHIRKLDFSLAGKEGNGLRSGGAVALSKVLTMSNVEVVDLKIDRNRIGPYGAAVLAQAVPDSPVRILSMPLNFVGEAGAEAIAQHLLRSKKTALQRLDLSLNNTGFAGVMHVTNALEFRQAESLPPVAVEVEGNLVFPEVMNSVTHAVGLVLCIVGTVLLSLETAGRSTRHVAACTLYASTLCLLFTSSTLYHSFFALKRTRAIFKVFDLCAIYLLITGSYTPFLLIVLPDQPRWSVGLFGFLWACTVLGVCLELLHQCLPCWLPKERFALILYLCMGWAALACMPDLISRLPLRALVLLVAGGVAYTAGVPFFVRNRNLDHAIWHIFVLFGAALHWFCIYLFVIAVP
eukprot:GGOE01054078.1.p1 GENE.GGOE01054078.1~~GGOE01054078.1.p1  ORF type:complete len:461 (+),score=104.40 GGOE01054078.1:114-1496(+)